MAFWKQEASVLQGFFLFVLVKFEIPQKFMLCIGCDA